MRISVILQFMLLLVLWKFKVEATTEFNWPKISSPVKLLGLFPRQSNGKFSNTSSFAHCHSMFRAAVLLSQEYNITFQGEYLGYEEILTDDDIMMTFGHTCEKVSSSNIIGFVGPAYSNEARYVASLAYRLGIVDISYSATSSDLSTIDTGAFYRISPSDDKTVLGIKILFEQHNWKSCIIVYQNDEYSYNGMHLLSQKLSERQIKTFETIKFNTNQENFSNDLKKTLVHSLSRIVIVWANEMSTVTILKNALEQNLIGQDFVWILSTTVSLEHFNQTQQQNLIGILTIQFLQEDFLMNTTLLNEAYRIWKSYEPNTFPGNDNVNIYALFTFDATWSLILSLQELCSIQSSCLQFSNVSDCYNRQFLHSKRFYDIMKTMRFLGVSGKVDFSNETPDSLGRISYVIKNIQPINTAEYDRVGYVSVLQWDMNSTQWIQYKNQSSEILWPNRSKNIPRDYKSIQGQELRIAIIESPPSIILKNPIAMYSNMPENYKRIDLTEFDGFYKDLILYLQDRMGFIPIILLAKPAIRYDELVHGVANDLFDIVMSSIDINAKRNQIVDFSIAIMPASYRVVIREPKSTLPDYVFSWRPFLWILWLLLLVIIPNIRVLISSIERKNDNDEHESLLIRMLIAISYLICKSFGTSQTNLGRFFTFISSILQIILLTVSVVGLRSFSLTENSKLTLSGIDDIKNGKIPSNRVGILVGSQIEEYYLNFISHGKKDYYPLKTPEEVYTRLIQGDIDASLWSNISTAYHINNMYCNLMTIGMEFCHSFYQIPLKRGWLYTADLNLNILSFMETGQLDQISTKWFGKHNCPKIDLFDIETKTVPVEPMIILFRIFAVISFISMLTHFWLIRNYIINIINRIHQKDSVPSNFQLLHNQSTIITRQLADEGQSFNLELQESLRELILENENMIILCLNNPFTDENPFPKYQFESFNDELNFVAHTLSIKDSRVFLIISTAVVDYIGPLVHDHFVIEQIFVFNIANHPFQGTWKSMFPKIIGCWSDMKQLQQDIIQLIRTTINESYLQNQSTELMTMLYTQLLENKMNSRMKIKVDILTNEYIVIFHCQYKILPYVNNELNNWREFNDIQSGIEFLEQENSKTIFLILSGGIVPTLVRSILDRVTIRMIYYFRTIENQYPSNRKKIGGFFTNSENLSKKLDEDIQIFHEQDTYITQIDIFPAADEEKDFFLLDDNQIGSLLLMLFIDVLLEMPLLKFQMTDIVKVCQKLPYKITNDDDLKLYLEELFEDNEDRNIYEENVDFLKILSNIRRLYEQNDLFLLQNRFMNIHKHIIESPVISQSVTLYLSKIVTNGTLELMKCSRGQMISIGFLVLATRSFLVARSIARRAVKNQLTTVCFEIEIDQNIHLFSVDETRVIFPLNTIFFLESINLGPDGVSYVKITCANEHFQHIKELFEYKTNLKLSWLTYGNYLAVFDRSEEGILYFDYLLNHLPKESIYHASIHNNIMLVQIGNDENDSDNQGIISLQNALKNIKSAGSYTTMNANEELANIQPPSNNITSAEMLIDRSTALGHIAYIYYRNEQYDLAMKKYKEALETSLDKRYSRFYQKMILLTFKKLSRCLS